MTLPLALGLPTNGLEWMFVFVVVLLLFGAKRLPELAKGLGRSLHEFKKAREDFETEIHKAHTPTPNPPTTPPLSQPMTRQLYNTASSAGVPASGSTINSGLDEMAMPTSQLEKQMLEMQEQMKVLAQQNAELRARQAAVVVKENEVVKSTSLENNLM